jgi:hypothetical protein
VLHYSKWIFHEKKILGKRKLVDNNIYTLDIETSSYFFLDEKQHNGLEYDSLSQEEKDRAIKCSCMYIWMLGINDTIYYGRTWSELKDFLHKITVYIPEKKIIFIHNLAFEFQYLYSVFEMENVFARKSHKVIKCEIKNMNIELRCSYFMTNAKLEKLPSIYNLPVEKKVGDLDYSKIRHSETPLTEKELGYCEYDCLVVYYYILFELKTYLRVDKIPVTSTGHVRKELKDVIKDNYSYKAKVRKSINTDPHIYNMLVASFQGGYTHANYIYTDEVIKDVDSFDETSAYPYVMVAYRFPSTEFKECFIKTREEMNNNFAYLLRVKFSDVKSKYYNNFISSSKCIDLRGAKYDNGRIIEAKSFEMILTDVDLKLYLDSYTCKYEIVESYYSVYSYLPVTYIHFILNKYVAKTKYKGVKEKELEYQLEKQKFNALYGMTVTNNIKDEVEFKDNIWNEVPLTNEEILEKLEEDKKAGFLSFSYGVWVTAYARNNLLRNVMKLDKYVIYCDTDSIKLIKGYDKTIIEKYNQTVKNRIEFTSRKLNIPLEKFSPKDNKGKEHMLGLFEYEGNYQEFITQGAKKYAVKEDGEIKITVAGVPKSGAKALKDLKNFKDGFIFRYKDTNKNLLFYVDNQEEHILKDYNGIEYKITDKSGCCILPNSYTLGKALDYCHLLSDDSSKRSIYKE